MAEFDPALTMYGQMDGNKIKTAYEKMMMEKSVGMNGQMFWPVDWFPEPMPIESATGNSIVYHLQAKANPMSTISSWPQADPGDVRKEDILVFSDNYGYCKEILEQAPPGRIGIQNVQSKPVEKYTKKDVDILVGMHPWDLIIFACGIDTPPSNSIEDIHQTQDAVLKLYLHILQKIGDDGTRCKRLAVITCDTFALEREIHEEVGLGLITNSTLFGMSNTARQEVQCPIQFIDTEWALRTENVKYISAEIFRSQSFGYNTVRILNSGRYVQRKMPSKLYEHGPDLDLPEDGVICITGGNGALGLVMGTWLLNTAKKQANKKFSIKFLSRSCKITDQNMPNWKEIQRLADELGIHVEQTKCDFSTAAACDKFIEAHTPNISGIIHSAGILQDSMLQNQTWEKFNAVLESKSRAATYMHDALERFENPKLKFFWLFSSGAVYGNMGQLNYSASNSFLDALARHRRALGKPCQAPQWGAWGDVGMAANLDDASRRRMANSPMPYFSNAEGLYGLECLIRSNLPYGEVHKCNPPLMFGMIQGDDLSQQCFIRQFNSNITPPPPGDPVKNPYLTISFEMRQAGNQTLANGLNFNHFWPELAEQMKEELQ